MNLETLNKQITIAIAKYEKSAEEVSRIEEEIAKLTSPSSAEGRIARRGAIRMALCARDEQRAFKLKDQYCEEKGAEADFCSELRAMLRPTLY